MIAILRRPAEVSIRLCQLRGLASYNLRQVQGIIADGVEDQILQPVHNAEELIS